MDIFKMIHVLIICSIILLILFVQCFQLDYSSIRRSFKTKLTLIPIVLNVLIVSSLTSFVLVFFHEVKLALAISSVLITIWSIANYFVVLYHGSPLFPYELLNIRTVANVLSGYRITINRVIVAILLLFLGELGLVFVMDWIAIHWSISLAISNHMLLLGIFIMITALVYILVFGKSRFKYVVKRTWSWETAIRNNGYCLYLSYVFKSYILADKKLNRYQKINISIPQTNKHETKNEDVDVILILNESLFDLQKYCHLDRKYDFLSELEEIQNITVGNAIVLSDGTNNSEFELLTGNSMLLTKPAPFNYMDFTTNSLATGVSYFHSLGFYTSALHWGHASNYRRGTAFGQIGFDEIILGREQFSYHTSNGRRPHLDIDDYHQLIDIYNRKNESSKFIFCVTYQNHGGYNQNPEEMNSVHISNDFGKLTHELNEYLSSVKLSTEAFKCLTEYFSKIDKHVIICMVGDHKPAFSDQLPTKGNASNDADQIARRLVPYFIWANFDYDTPENSAYASITDLLPMTINAAGLPLSPWYQQILNLHKVAPARYFNDTYLDNDGNLCAFKDSKIAQKDLLNYYAMASNNIRGGKNFREDIFKPL